MGAVHPDLIDVGVPLDERVGLSDELADAFDGGVDGFSDVLERAALGSPPLNRTEGSDEEVEEERHRLVPRAQGLCLAKLAQREVEVLPQPCSHE